MPRTAILYAGPMPTWRSRAATVERRCRSPGSISGHPGGFGRSTVAGRDGDESQMQRYSARCDSADLLRSTMTAGAAPP